MIDARKRVVRKREWVRRRAELREWLSEARCFFTWPFGHAYDYVDKGVPKCVSCGRHQTYNL